MRLSILYTGLALLIAGPVSADERPKDSPKADQSYEVPYKLTGTNHVMVRVKLNGKGPFNFILDTGAPALIMSEEVGKKVGANAEGWSKFKLEIEGGVTLPEAKGMAIDMFQLKGMNAMGVAGAELHGVLGYNILAKFRTTYDFTQDKLVLVPLKFEPPEIIRISKDEADGQGGLEMIGNLMKFMAPLLGLKPNFEVKPRGFLGVELAQARGFVSVKSVIKDSPADKAGIKVGDLIGGSSASLDDLLKVVAKLREGDKIKLQIKRGEETKDLSIELGKGL